jgi:hypothetical protein
MRAYLFAAIDMCVKLLCTLDLCVYFGVYARAHVTQIDILWDSLSLQPIKPLYSCDCAHVVYVYKSGVRTRAVCV